MTVKEKLKKYIVDCRKAGRVRLPAERRLAEILKTTRKRIRMNMAVLRSEGKVKSVQGSGHYIVERKVTRKKKVIGYVTSLLNPFDYHFLKMSECMRNAAKDENLSLNIYKIHPKSNKEKIQELKQTIKKDSVTGVITGLINPDILSALAQVTEIVTVNDIWGLRSGFSFVTPNNTVSGFLAGEHFYRTGHRKIGYISKSIEPINSLHIQGLRMAANQFGLELNEDSILLVPKFQEIKIKRILDFFSKIKASAFLGGGDRIIAEVMMILLQHGYQVPKDFSFIGCGNYTKGLDTPFPITTIDPKYDLCCLKAVEILKKRTVKHKSKKSYFIVTPELIERESVKRI